MTTPVVACRPWWPAWLILLALASLAWAGRRLSSRIEARGWGVIDALNLQQDRD